MVNELAHVEVLLLGYVVPAWDGGRRNDVGVASGARQGTKRQ